MDRLLCNLLCRTRLPYVVVAKARNVLFISCFLRFLRVLKVGEFYSMFFHKAGQCEYFLCSVFEICVIFAEEIQS